MENEASDSLPAAPKTKKKKKKKPTVSAENEGEKNFIESISPLGPETVATPQQSPAPPTQGSPRFPSSVASPRKKKKKKKPSSGQSDKEPRNTQNTGNSLNESTSTFTSRLPACASTASLLPPGSRRAQLATSCVRVGGLTEKTVEPRSNGPTFGPTRGKKGFWSKFSKKEEKDDVALRENRTVRMEAQAYTYMRQMIGPKSGPQPMKWENFLRVGLHHGPHSHPSNSMDLGHEGDGLQDEP